MQPYRTEAPLTLRTPFVVLDIVVTLALSSLTYGGLELYKQETLQRNQAGVDESASLAADRIATRVRDRRDYIGYVASQPATADVSSAGVAIGGVDNSRRFFGGQVVAANGTVVAFGGQVDETVRREAGESDVSDEAYFSEATTRSSYVSAPEAVPGRERYLVVISAPIITDEGFEGVFAASIYVSSEALLDPVAALDTRHQRVQVTVDDTVLLDTVERFEQRRKAGFTNLAVSVSWVRLGCAVACDDRAVGQGSDPTTTPRSAKRPQTNSARPPTVPTDGMSEALVYGPLTPLSGEPNARTVSTPP
jgi:hypothetical protein